MPFNLKQLKRRIFPLKYLVKDSLERLKSLGDKVDSLQAKVQSLSNGISKVENLELEIRERLDSEIITTPPVESALAKEIDKSSEVPMSLLAIPFQVPEISRRSPENREFVDPESYPKTAPKSLEVKADSLNAKLESLSTGNSKVDGQHVEQGTTGIESTEIASLTIPIVFLVFNRPDHTAKVFSAIRAARPEKLLIVADGPRKDRDDHAKCASVRSIVQKIDWDCEVLTHFSDENLGCAACVSQGINWAFTHVESAIILEDDCLPGPDFFRFCEQVIPRYKDDSRVGMITGNNLSGLGSPYSYHFSHLSHIWGWATWRSAWAKYDRTLTKWPELRDSGYLEQYFQNKRIYEFWKRNFDSVYQADPNDWQHTWDYQWFYTHLINNWLVVMPTENLVANIGFDGEATHTKDAPHFQLPRIGKIKFPLLHPPALVPLRNLDQKVYDEILAPIPEAVNLNK